MVQELPLVRDFMASKLRTLQGETDILKAVDFLAEHAISGAPVVDDLGRLIGVLSEKDCLKLVAEGVNAQTPQGTVSDFMTREVETLPPDMDLYYAAGMFLRKPYRRFPVVKDGKLVGQISRRDVLRAVQWTLRCEQLAEATGAA
ncbi:MAG: CBS domain-containing protein [Acidobacteriota bacterium]